MDQNSFSVSKKMTFRKNGCYGIGLWSSGDVFDSGNNPKMYKVEGEYNLSIFSGDILLKTRIINPDKDYSFISGNGPSVQSMLGLEVIRIPYQDKYSSLTFKLNVKNPKQKFRDTYDSTYFFIDNSYSDCSKENDLRKLKRSIGIDNNETTTTLIKLKNILKEDKVDELKALVDSGMSLHVKMLGDREPLHIATFYNAEKSLQYLIDSNDMNLSTKDKVEKTALQYAIENNATKTAELLLENGADLSLIKLVDDYLQIYKVSVQIPIIQYISMSNFYELTKILLKHGLNPNYRTSYAKDKFRITAFEKLQQIRKSQISSKELYEYDATFNYTPGPNYDKILELFKTYGAKTTEELNKYRKKEKNTILKESYSK